MAKGKSQSNNKISFGKKRRGPGSAKKAYGPKEQKPKKYVGQGRM